MARFSVCGGDDGEGSSTNQSRKRQRLPSIDEENAEELPFIEEENAEEDSDAGSSGEEDEEDDRRETRIESEYRGSTSDDSDPEVVLEEIIRFVDPVNSESSSIQDSSSLSITLSDPDVLDCPICCEPLKVPIFQCDNGHLACSVCCTKVKNICPSCTLPIGYNRCRAMEKVIEASRVSCPNAKYGCNEKMPYGNRLSHEELCVYAPCSCPVLNCNYTGYYKDLHSHVGAKHKDDVIPFAWNVSVRISLDPDKKTIVLQEEKDGEVIVVQAFRDVHVVNVAVSCIAPLSPRVRKLSFLSSLVNDTEKRSLKQGFMVKNIQKVTAKQPEDDFMVIPCYMLSGCLRIWISRSSFYVDSSLGLSLSSLAD